MNVDINKFHLTPVGNLKNYHFVVEKYQRGYKWNATQVRELLNDINEFEGVGFYCLQPVVVNKIHEDNIYELIDGQQRITTIFILLGLIRQRTSKYLYTISYKTRQASESFLNTISIKLGDISIDKYDERLIKEAWGDYIKNNPNDDNVDNYHFFTTYCVIKQWLQTHQNVIDAFINKLLNQTKFIWYEINSSESSEVTFINFNQGKIPLAQAELIKALFVLQLKKEPNLEVRSLKTNIFAQEWNTIEMTLQDDKFWYFVSNDTSDKEKSNRIDLLFNLLKQKPKNHQDGLFAYREYLNEYQKENTTGLGWEEVKNTFDILLEWFNNRSIYHLIGFLLNENKKTINEVIAQYQKENTKDGFKIWLRESIKENYINNDKYDLETITYKEPKIAHSILLLFNIISYQKSDISYRFPFHLFKISSTWSLEHIHAQRAEKFETIQEVKDWIADLKVLKKDYEKAEEYRGNTMPIDFSIIEELLNNTTKIELSREIKREAVALENITNELFDKDNLKNLCLLDKNTNSSFSNDPFISKREKLLKIDSGNFKDDRGNLIKPFIPLATKNVFLKYYSKNTEAFQMSYWGYEDRKQYVECIAETFNSFFNVNP